MAQPVVDLLGRLIRHAHWPILALLVVYLGSGITAVKADEVALVLRFGGLVGDTPGAAIQKPGLLWALPRPIDEVVRVKVQKVHEVEIDALWRFDDLGVSVAVDPEGGAVIDPEIEGYALTGDRNIVQLAMLVRYQVLDPIAYALAVEDPHTLLVDVVQAEMVRAAGEGSVEDILSDQRTALVARARQRSQAALDALDSGLDLIAIELLELSPPVAVIPEFVDVYTAFIEAGRTYVEAQRYREMELPKAQADAGALVSDARIYATTLTARARGEAGAFERLLIEYRKSPVVVRDRLYLEGVEDVFDAAGKHAFVQPPIDGTYTGFRYTIPTRR